MFARSMVASELSGNRVHYLVGSASYEQGAVLDVEIQK